MIRKYLAASFTALVATLAFSADEASAMYQQNHPGLLCRAAPGSAGTYAQYYGTIYNSSSSSQLSLICPLINSDFQDGIEAVVVGVWDVSATQDVSCTVHCEYPDGNGIFGSDQTDTSSGVDTDFQELIMGTDQDGCDYYWMACTIPARYSGAYSHLIRTALIEQ